MICCKRFRCLFGSAVLALLPATPVTAATPSSNPDDSVRVAVKNLQGWLGEGSAAERWNQYLLTQDLLEQLGEEGNDDRVVRAALVRYASDAPGLDRPEFVAVRQSLQQWLAANWLPSLDRLPQAARESMDGFSPPAQRELRWAAQRTRRDVEALLRFLEWEEFDAGWKRYLKVGQLSRQLAKGGEADVASLANCLSRLRADYPGLSEPPFFALRTSLARLIARLRLAREADARERFRWRLHRLADAVEEHARVPSPRAVDDARRAIQWLDRHGQALALVRVARRFFWPEAEPGSAASSPPRPQPRASVARARPRPRPFAPAPRVRLMSAAKDAMLRRLLPQVDEPELQHMLNDPSLILFTEAEMPKAYQFWDGQFNGVHRADYNISADDNEPHGNANHEFPWGAPAGTHQAKNTGEFRFLWLPRDQRGKFHPVVWHRKLLRGDSAAGYAWTFPAGAVVGEVLVHRSPKGYGYPFELRVRFREHSDWGVDVYRPFPTALSLAQRIQQLRPYASRRPQLARLVSHLTTPRALPRRTLADNHPTRSSFGSSTMGVDVLPEAGEDRLVERLLSETRFTSALQTAWRVGSNGVWTAAPTTRARFHIVPADYSAGFIQASRKSCVRCHNTVNQHVNEFEFGRDWYGRVRGSDGIFSFYPFSPSSLSGNGISSPVSMRQTFTAAGVVEPYDRSKHSSSIYRSVPYLVE